MAGSYGQALEVIDKTDALTRLEMQLSTRNSLSQVMKQKEDSWSIVCLQPSNKMEMIKTKN